MELTARVRAVLRHGRFVNGPEVSEFEKAMADYIGVKHAISCNSGTDALYFALKVLGVNSQDNQSVAVPAFTFSATASAVMRAGGIPHFVDIKEDDFSIDVKQIDHPDILNAIIVVDMFGIPADWDSVFEFVKEHKIGVIEDACQAIGAKINGAMCGRLGVVGCASFYPSKPLPCCGDGGMMFIDYDKAAASIRTLKDHGRRDGDKYIASMAGLNSRLDTIQAAILLDRLTDFNQHEIPHRIWQASEYFDKLNEGRHYEGIPGREPVWSWYPVLYANQRERDEAFQTYGGYAGANIIYPEPLHLQPAFKYRGYKRGHFPVAESVCERILAFPIVHHWESNKCLAMITSAESASIVLRS